MTRKEINTKPVKAAEYVQGWHPRWEAEMHSQEEVFKKTNGRIWNYDERRTAVSRYLTRTPYLVAYEVVQCAQCAEEYASAVLEGKDPYAQPQWYRDERRKLTMRIGSTLGIRKRHIDSV